MIRSLSAMAIVVSLAGCSATHALRETDLPAAPPKGVVGLAHPKVDFKLYKLGFDGIAQGSGFYLAPDLLLVTAHQNFRQIGPLNPNAPIFPAFIPYLFLNGSFPRLTPWQTMQVIGQGPVATRIQRLEERWAAATRGWRGALDMGWCLLKVDPPYEGPLIRCDFERELEPGQEVYVLRPVAYGIGQKRGDEEETAQIDLDRNNLEPHLAVYREWAAEIGDRPTTFYAWKGRIARPPGRAVNHFAAPDPWSDRIGWVMLEGDDDLGGASGGPVLIRDGNEWVAVGMYSSSTNFDGQWISKYQYGVFVRPELTLP